MRFRHIFMLGGGAMVLAALLYTDPDGGISTGMLLLSMVTPLLAVGFAHLARKAMFDFGDADSENLFKSAGREPTGAGLALIALAIVIYGLLGLFGGRAHAQDVNSYIPTQASQYRLVLIAEQRGAWPDHPAPHVLAALVEHESCISLRHSRCWNPASQLKTAREEGAGLGQITRAYNANGSIRFDALAEMRDRNPSLRALSWSNVYQRPDLQLRALVLMSRGNYQGLRVINDPWQRLAFADAAYNGGLGGVQNERRACAMRAGCDPQQWFGHVEQSCLKSKTALYGQRSACDINRHHVRDVLMTRAPKYRGWWA